MMKWIALFLLIAPLAMAAPDVTGVVGSLTDEATGFIVQGTAFGSLDGSASWSSWEAFTDAVLRHLAEGERRLVFVLWGRQAQKKTPLLGSRHVVLTAGHPSPLSVRHFRGCGHFTAINAAIEGPAIEWRLPSRKS